MDEMIVDLKNKMKEMELKHRLLELDLFKLSLQVKSINERMNENE